MRSIKIEYTLKDITVIPAPLADVFPFFSAAENLERITPPSLRFEIVTPLPIEMREGLLIDYKLRINGIPAKWKTLISLWNPPHEFVDEQLKGPYRTWVHHHRFREENGDTVMEDEVRYEIPLGPLGRIAAPIVRRQVQGIFKHRKQVITDLYGPK